jgi:hypothetical protein
MNKHKVLTSEFIISNIYSYLSLVENIQIFKEQLYDKNRDINKLIKGFELYLNELKEIDYKVVNINLFKNINPNGTKLKDSIKKLKNVSNVNNLPNKLTHLVFSNDFNQLIGKYILPNTITHLTFGNDFNQPIVDYVLPNTLTHLTFGNNFNQLIGEYVLPNSITHLTFGYYFEQRIDENVLPEKLTH